MIVVDVTVLAYFLIDGDETASVVRLRRQEPDWIAPNLWHSELMNVLWKYVRRGDFGLDIAIEHITFAEGVLGPRIFALRAEEVLPLAVSSGCSAYDCQYVALAKRLGIPLVTHDTRIITAFPQVAVRPEALHK